MTHPVPLPSLVDFDATTIYFQPIVDLRSGQVVAYETLLRVPGKAGRWDSPVSLLARIDALPAATRLSCHRRLLARILPAAIAVRADSGNRVAVNLPAPLLEDARAVATLQQSDGAGIILEILETAAIKKIDSVHKSVSALHACGYSVAIDDYGSGYSTAALLAALPAVDLVKIDLVFSTTERGRAMLPALCRVVGSAGARIVVEGIESVEGDRLAREAGADFGQGYFYGFPAPYEFTKPGYTNARILMGTTRNVPVAVR